MAPSRPPRPPARPARDPKEVLKKRGADLIRKVSDKDRYAIFAEPVDLKQVPDYVNIIQRPMDLSTAQKNLQMGVYRTPMELRSDLDLIWSNCCTFNADDSIYYKEAVRLRALAARYYDDFVRALARDGAANALGLTSSRQNGPNSSRLVGKRPPRHRLSGPHSGPVPSSIHTSEPTSPEADAEPSISASASGSASAGVLSSFRENQLRRAQAASDAAAAAAAIAEEESRAAAIAAGITPGSPTGSNIFAGPQSLWRSKTKDANRLSSQNVKHLHRQRGANRSAEIPYAWRRIGRWHTPGATFSRLNSKDRAFDVRYGQKYENYVKRSAPVARRILAAILDAQVVSEHDQNVLPQQEALHRRPNGVHSVGENGRLSLSENEPMAKRRKIVNGKNGIQRPKDQDEMDIDTDGSTQPSPERGISRTGKGESEAAVHGQYNNDVDGSDQGCSSKQNCPTSKKSISQLQSLLKEHKIDDSFLKDLVAGQMASEKEKPETKSKGSEAPELMSGVDSLSGLLSANHSMMMNVLRLRALREGADEAECEDLEDRERECVEGLAMGMSLAVRDVAPNLLVHSLDAAESSAAFCESIQPPPQK